MKEMKKRISLEALASGLKMLWMRFPLSALSTAVITVCGVVLIFERDLQLIPSVEHFLIKLLLIVLLAFPVLTALVLISEKMKWKPAWHWGAQGISLVLLAMYFFVLPANPNDFGDEHMSRLALWNIVAYLVAISFPFYEKGNSVRFWRFVEHLFGRAVVSVFFSFTLWGGIALSLAAIDYLFGVKIQGEWYAALWVTVLGIFGAWFLLSGFPKVGADLAPASENSKILRVFIQYLCVPLLVVFFVILYVYLGQIVVLWDWPKGGVADWILGFSSAGFLVYILSSPLLKKPEHPKLSKFFQWFFILVLPMVLVLFFAVGIRISEYGVTESRYLVALGGIWLLVASLYFLLSKHKELKMLPYLVALFLFLASWGPWSMYAVSVRSQYAHLEGLLTTHNLLQNGEIVPTQNEEQIPQDDRYSIYSKILYLAQHDKDGKLDQLFDGVTSSSRYQFAQGAMGVLNIQKYSNYSYYDNYDMGRERLRSSVQSERVNFVSGFDYFLSDVFVSQATPEEVYQTENMVHRFSLSDMNILNVSWVHTNDQTESSINLNLSEQVKNWRETASVYAPGSKQVDSMILEFETPSARYKVVFAYLNLEQNDEIWSIESARMQVLIDEK